MGQLQGKVALISGASRGIGRALAVGFAREGASLMLGARTVRSAPDGAEGSLEEVVADIKNAGGQAVAARLDVSRSEDVRHFVGEALKHFGQIDILMNNAGTIRRGDLLALDPRDWDEVFQVNVKGPFLLAQSVLQHMLERGRGSIVNITTLMSRLVMPGDFIYGPSKAALDRFSQNLAETVRKHGVAVNGLNPGLIASAMTLAGSLDRKGQPPKPADSVVAPALWLARQTASSFTGKIVDAYEFGDTWGR